VFWVTGFVSGFSVGTLIFSYLPPVLVCCGRNERISCEAKNGFKKSRTKVFKDGEAKLNKERFLVTRKDKDIISQIEKIHVSCKIPISL